MKKNNKLTVYILGISVALVWGIIIYKVVAALSEDDGATPTAVSAPASKEPLNDHSIIKDTSTLKLNYRDPFGQHVSGKDTAQRAVTKLIANASHINLRVERPIAKPIVNWSFIKYAGYIRNPHSKKLYALINVNGKSVMLSEGETSGDIKLIRNLKDSIKISYQNRTQYIAVNTGS
jgi:hypothetical protein